MLYRRCQCDIDSHNYYTSSEEIFETIDEAEQARVK
jgi:hypothetical protein